MRNVLGQCHPSAGITNQHRLAPSKWGRIVLKRQEGPLLRRRYLLPVFLLAAVFILAPAAASAHGIHANNGTIQQASFGEFVSIGARHMLSGYDHLLFV